MCNHSVVFHRKCLGPTPVMGQLTNIIQRRHDLVHPNVCACLYWCVRECVSACAHVPGR